MSKVVSNKKQLEQLVKYMEENPDIAKGICVKTQAKKRWERFAIDLNSLGPPTRTWEKWLKVWTDLKCKIKKKKSENKQEIMATGGGPNKQHVFSKMEESVIGLLDINSCVDPPGLEFGQIHNSEEHEVSQRHYSNKENESYADDPDFIVDAEFEELKSLVETPEQANIFNESVNLSDNKSRKGCSLYKNNKKDEERLNLLAMQTSAHQAFHSDIMDIMRDIKTSTKNMEANVKRQYYMQKDYNKELLAIKKEKLKTYKDEVKNQQRDRSIKLQLKKQILELQKELRYNSS